MKDYLAEQPDFESVLFNVDDQATVRRLLIELVPEATRAEVVEGYNSRIRVVNAMRREHNEEQARRMADGRLQPDY